MYLEGPIDDSTEDTAYGLEDENLAFSNSDGEECPLQGNDEAETQMKQNLIIVANNLMISCKHISIEDMILDLLGRGLVLKRKKKSYPRRKHPLRRSLHCRKSQTKVRAL